MSLGIYFPRHHIRTDIPISDFPSKKILNYVKHHLPFTSLIPPKSTSCRTSEAVSSSGSDHINCLKFLSSVFHPHFICILCHYIPFLSMVPFHWSLDRGSCRFHRDVRRYLLVCYQKHFRQIYLLGDPWISCCSFWRRKRQVHLFSVRSDPDSLVQLTIL